MATTTIKSGREQQKAQIERKLIKKPQTAGEIATKLGLKSGQGISRSLGELVKEKRAVRYDGRRPTYAKRT